ncbi:structural maintenance of chromosomes protein 3 homolog isoform X2 [Pseudomyrmex gracilis]|nr:structural maintenance of chromosomes protein 3 homolog isoform X2 [Pseudomyrmex gracilis]
MNITNVAKTRRTRSTNCTKIERNDISSVCKTITTMSRARKRKGKLQSFVSKSTVTKNTSFTNRKNVKRHRRKIRHFTMNHNVIHPQSIPIKHSKKTQEIVEIFDNTTLKSSNSELSSKYSKFNRQAKTIKKQHNFNINVNQKIQDQLPSEQSDHKNQCYNSENQQLHLLSNQNNVRVISENVQQQGKFKKSSIKSSPSIQKSKLHQYENAVFNRFNDPTFTPSYEMPTLASRLKRSNKSYFSKFNFRNIPFVVGTSVTPSHNLGLNIQQVLNVIKMRQPLANDIAPLLIQKVGKSMNPVLNCLEQINDQCENLFFNSNQQISKTFNNKVNLNMSKDKNFSILNLQNVEKTQNVCVPNISDNAKLLSEKDNNNAKQLSKEEKDEHKIKRQFSSIINILNLPVYTKDQRDISGKVVNKYKIGNYNAHISVSRNSKEIRDILTNIYNQFEEMNKKYEKLLSEVEKSNDKSVAKKLSVLEKELNVKEKEINAMIGLCKEVMVLKQQVNMLRKQNSPVCTELAKDISCKTPFPISILSDKLQSINSTEIFDERKIFSVTRKQPAAIQLTALLRQIQTFHKQLQLVL